MRRPRVDGVHLPLSNVVRVHTALEDYAAIHHAVEEGLGQVQDGQQPGNQLYALPATRVLHRLSEAEGRSGVPIHAEDEEEKGDGQVEHEVHRGNDTGPGLKKRQIDRRSEIDQTWLNSLPVKKA